MTKRGGHWTSYTGVHIPDPVLAIHRNGHPNGSTNGIGWEPYPEIQVETAAEIVRALINAYGAQEIIGHDDIAPNRKWDPGPAFDMAGFRDRVQDDLSSDDDIRLLSHTPGDTLNLRVGPGLSHAVLSELKHETPLAAA